mgnify:CR=1 FL=1
MITEQIKKRLVEKLSATHVQVVDESQAHVGHMGAQMGGGHYFVTVVSEQFSEKNTINRQRLVYQALQEEMKQAVHALRMETYTSEEWKKRSPL